MNPFVSFIRPRHAATNGIALVTVLFALVIMTVLTVGFVANMRVERRVSSIASHTQQTELIADSALAHAISLLRSNIPDPAPLSVNASNAPAQAWFSNPGRLTLVSEGRTVDLHSGVASSNDDLDSFDLNRPLPGSMLPPIAASLGSDGLPSLGQPSPSMRVRWIPLLKNPAEPASADNPIVGRYAFWIDDDSSKINFNTAYGKPPFDTLFSDPRVVSPTYRYGKPGGQRNIGAQDMALGHPSSVNLNVFDPNWVPDNAAGDNLGQMVWRNGFYQSPDAIAAYAPGTNSTAKDAWFNTNRFMLTHYNRSPQFNVFGMGRIFPVGDLQTLEIGPVAQWPVLAGSNYHHPLIPNVVSDSAAPFLKLNRELIEAYLARADWPRYNGSLESKLGGPAAAQQLALDLVAMFRFGSMTLGGIYTERMRDIINPFNPNTAANGRNSRNNPNAFLTQLGTGDYALPQTPPPYLNEIAVTFKAVPNPDLPGSFQIEFQFKGELFNPPFGLNLSPRTVARSNLQLCMAALTIIAKDSDPGNAEPITFAILPPVPPDAAVEASGSHWGKGPWSRYFAPLQTPLNATDQFAVLEFPTNWTVGSETRLARIRNGGTFPGNISQAANFPAGGTVTLSGGLRIGLAYPDETGGDNPYPVSVAPITPGQLIEFEDVELPLVDGGEVTVAWEIEDPRLYRLAENWIQTSTSSLGVLNSNQTGPAGADLFQNRKLRYLRTGQRDIPESGGFGIAPIGLISLLSVGILTNEPWKSLDFADTGEGSAPPDWLLLDLIAAGFRGSFERFKTAGSGWATDNTRPDRWSSIGHLHSQAGQVNLNTRVFPSNAQFNVPPRTLAIRALLKDLRPEADVSSIVDAWAAAETASDGFLYVGEAVRVPGFADGANAWQQEWLMRHAASALTTQSNVFTVHGVAQAVKKIPSNTNYGLLEEGDQVLATKRFEAKVERSVWLGIDGSPGNARTNAAGEYSALATPAAQFGARNLPGGASNFLGSGGVSWSPMDGPGDNINTAVRGNLTFSPTPLDQAYNPAELLMRYRTIYFRYLE